MLNGQWSTRDLAADLNGHGVPSPKGTRWATSTVAGILSNPAYAGLVRYNQRAGLGHYVPTPSSAAFVVEGKHEALIDRDLFETVQRRRAEARSYQCVARKTPHAHLIAGLLRCAECGGLMVPTVAGKGKDGHKESGRQGQMRCAGRHEGRTACTASSYRLDLATDALLAQVRRLRGSPWTLEQEQLLAGDEGAAAAALERALQQARDKLTRANRRFMIEIEEPTAEDRAAFEAVRCEMGARIRELEQQQAQLQHDAQALPRLRKLHQQLTRTEIGDVIDRLGCGGRRACGTAARHGRRAERVGRAAPDAPRGLRGVGAAGGDGGGGQTLAMVAHARVPGVGWAGARPPAPPECLPLLRHQRHDSYHAADTHRS